jgi:hypothetical protein
MDIHSQANVQQIRKRTTITKYQVFSLLSLINFQIEEEEKMIEKYFLIHVTDRQTDSVSVGAFEFNCISW